MIRKLKVLLVEDEQLVRETLKMILQKNEQYVKIIGEASNGREAISMIEAVCPDLIICDIVMPQMNGLELLSYVNQKYKEIHTIILSGYSDFEYVKSAFKSGAVDYILKPQLSPENLMACVFHLIELKNLNCENQDSNPCDQLLAYINEHYMEPITLQDAADFLHLSYTNLSSKFTAETGKGFKEVLNDVRIGKAKERLINSSESLLTIALEVGYTDQSYFCKVFKQKTGESPLAYRSRHQ